MIFMEVYKFFKRYFILFLLLIFLLNLCCVYANDGNVTDDNSLKITNNSITVSLDENEDLLGKTYSLNGGKFSDIQNVINKAKKGDTIRLSGLFKSDGKQITIDKKLTITSSKGAILDGNGKSGIFNIKSNAKGLVINNIIFENAYTTKKGGAIYLNAPNVIIDKCIFQECFAHAGGAISTSASTSNQANNLIIRNSVFYSNHAVSYGGAIGYVSKNLEMTSCIFDSNYVELDKDLGGGGVLHIGFEDQDNNCKITDCSFSNNYMKDSDENKGHGGVACLRRGVMFTNCNFTNNVVYESGVLGFHDGGIVINCKFYDNHVTEHGGVLKFDPTNQPISISDSDFENNTANYGGTISIHADGLITNCRFTNNGATEGGVVYTSKNKLTIQNSIFNGNYADSGSSIYSNNCQLSIKDSNFNLGFAEDGGVIYSINSPLNICNSNFTNNIADNGGVIYANGNNVVICDSNFINNGADNGGVIFSNCNELKVLNSLFENNRALYGGALIITNLSTSFVNGSYFINNSALNGSAIYNDGTLNISDSLFRDNQAHSYNIISSDNAPVKKGEDLIIKVKLVVGDNVADAIHNQANLIINNTKPSESNLAINQELLLILNNDTYIVKTDEDGIAEFIIDTSDLNADNYTYFIFHIKSSLYDGINYNKTIEILQNPTDNTYYFKEDILGSSIENTVVKSKKNKHYTKKHSNINDYLNSKGYSNFHDLIFDSSSYYQPKIEERFYKSHNKHPDDKGLIGYLQMLADANTPDYTRSEYYNNGGWLPDTIFALSPIPRFITYYSSWRVSEAIVNTDGSLWSILNYPFIHFPGYAAHVEDWGYYKGVLGAILGIDEKGNMSILDLILNIISLLPLGLAGKGSRLLPLIKGKRLYSVIKPIVNNHVVKKILEVGNFFVKGFEVLSNPNNLVTIMTEFLYKKLPEGFKSNGINGLISFLSNPIRDVFYVLNPKNWQNIINEHSKKINFNPLRGLKNQFNTSVKYIKNKVHELTKTINKKVKNLLNQANKKISIIKNKITSIVKNGTKIVLKKVNKLLNRAKSEVNKIKTKAKKIVNQVKSEVNKIKTKANKMVKNIKLTVNKINKFVNNTIKKQVNKIVKKVNNTVKKVQTKTNNMIKTTKSNVQKLKTMSQSGYNYLKSKAYSGYNWFINKIY